VITADEMRDRLAALCLGGATGLPRRSRDLHILLASATLWMEPGAIYAEREVNESLARWLDGACPSLSVDVVTLRRELVDRLYLDRDDSGASYSPGPGPREWQFSDDVADIDPVEVIETARAEREARKSAHMSGGDEERSWRR
jgi:hypothetical protein